MSYNNLTCDGGIFFYSPRLPEVWGREQELDHGSGQTRMPPQEQLHEGRGLRPFIVGGCVSLRAVRWCWRRSSPLAREIPDIPIPLALNDVRNDGGGE